MKLKLHFHWLILLLCCICLDAYGQMPPPKHIYQYRVYGSNGTAVKKTDTSYKVSFPSGRNLDNDGENIDDDGYSYRHNKNRRLQNNKENLYTFSTYGYNIELNSIHIAHGGKAMTVWPMMNIDSLTFSEGYYYVPKAYVPLFRTHFTGQPLGNFIYPSQIKNYSLQAFKAKNANDTPKLKIHLDAKLLYTFDEKHPLKTASYSKEYNIISVNTYGKYQDSIFISKDKGKSWDGLPLPDEKMTVLKLSVLDKEKYCLLVGTRTSPYLTYLLQTNDNGTSWRRISFFDSLKVRDIIFTSHDIAYALCWANDTVTNIYKTENGGLDWQLLNIQSSLNVYRSMWFSSPLTGYLFTNNYRDRKGYLNKTEDGGNTWMETIYPDYFFDCVDYTAGYCGLYMEKSSFNTIKAYDKNTMVFCDNEYFLKSNDGGKSWEYVPILEILFSENTFNKRYLNNDFYYGYNDVCLSRVAFLDKDHVLLSINNSLYNLKL